MRITLVTETFFPGARRRPPGPAGPAPETTVKAVADRLVDTGHEVPGGARPGLTSYRSSRVARVGPPAGPGARSATRSRTSTPTSCTSPPRPHRPRALKHAPRLGRAPLVTEQSPLLDATEDHWAARVAERADRRRDLALDAEALAGLGVEAALLNPGTDGHAFTPELRDPWLHRTWGREGRVVVGYAGPLARRDDVRDLARLARCRASGSAGRRGRPAELAGRPAAGRQAGRPAGHRGPRHRTREPRRPRAPRTVADVLPRAPRGRRVGVPVVAPRAGAPPISSATWRPACSTTRPPRPDSRRPWPPSPPTPGGATGCSRTRGGPGARLDDGGRRAPQQPLPAPARGATNPR